MRAVEAQTDVNVSTRLKYVREAHPYAQGKRAVWLAQTLRRLKRQKDVPKYSMFYDIDPLVSFAFFASITVYMPTELLLDRSYVALRLSTLMRNVDVQSIVFGLFRFQREF